MPSEESQPHHPRRPRDWAWRARLRAQPRRYRLYRAAVASVGLFIVVVGLILVPLPGPGWLIVFVGVGVWASEFHWAKRLHAFGHRHLHRWTAWIMAQNLLVRGLVGAAGILLVAACFWCLFKVTGLPTLTPDWAATFLRAHLAL